MSKSVGNVVAPDALVDTFGLDQVRYFLLREVPFGQDGSYSEEAITARTNADLANDLGNLAQRSLTMIARNCGGVVPTPGALDADDEALLATARGLPERARAAMSSFEIHAMLQEIWALVGEVNRYFAAREPWTLRKTDPERMSTVLWVTAEALRAVAILAQPAIPTAAAKLLDMLGVSNDARAIANVDAADALRPGTPLPPPTALFPRIEVASPEAAHA